MISFSFSKKFESLNVFVENTAQLGGYEKMNRDSGNLAGLITDHLKANYLLLSDAVHKSRTHRYSKKIE